LRVDQIDRRIDQTQLAEFAPVDEGEIAAFGEVEAQTVVLGIVRRLLEGVEITGHAEMQREPRPLVDAGE